MNVPRPDQPNPADLVAQTMLKGILSRNTWRSRTPRPSSRLVTEIHTSTTPTTPTPTDTIRPKRKPRPPLATAIILNRAPILTQTPSAFERAYYDYQARIQRALHNPFPYEFYFKQGSPLESRFNLEEWRREKKAFGRPFSLRSVPGGEELSKTAEQLVPQEGEGEVVMPRRHEADTKNDVKSLDRRGQRNLYLLLMNNEGGKENWRFPQGGVGHSDLLHTAAQRSLIDECGPYMDTWIVSRNPIGVYKPPLPNQLDESSPVGTTFFFKAHIMAGQVRPDGKVIHDFAWLTKQEISTRVDGNYWLGVQDMLSDL